MTQYQKVMTVLCQSPNRWFYPFDFMRPEAGDLFVGYKAGTRLAELAHDYPGMLEKRVEGKYTQYRVCKNTVGEWFNTIPKDLRQVVAKELDYYPYRPVEG